MITAQEALARVQAAGLAETLTTHIDQAILANANKGWPHKVTYPLDPGAHVLLDVLVGLYRAGGWIALPGGGERDRDNLYLVLDLPRKSDGPACTEAP